MGGGWKTKLGGLIKGVAGSALGYVVTQLHDIPIDPNTKTGLAVSIALLFISDALQKIGIGHKIDKQNEAMKDAAK